MVVSNCKVERHFGALPVIAFLRFAFCILSFNRLVSSRCNFLKFAKLQSLTQYLQDLFLPGDWSFISKWKNFKVAVWLLGCGQLGTGESPWGATLTTRNQLTGLTWWWLCSYFGCCKVFRYWRYFLKSSPSMNKLDQQALSHLGKQFFEWPERPPVKWHHWAFKS